MVAVIRWRLSSMTLPKIIVIAFIACCCYIYTSIVVTETIVKAEDNKDFCLKNTCDTNAMCIALPSGFECKCLEGFYGDGWKCYDLDECLLLTGNCSQDRHCTNTIGSYECRCNDDYTEVNGTCIELEKKAERRCSIHVGKNFPLCAEKVEWMKRNWKTHNCYADNGVDGTLCTMLDYLSQVEIYCPAPSGANKIKKHIKQRDTHETLTVGSLLKILGSSKNFAWISTRIKSMWKDSITALNKLRKGRMSRSTPKRILVFIGALADTQWSWATHATKGGPLGELVQWSDLLLSLYLLGHPLVVSVSVADLKERRFSKTPCNDRMELNDFDLIYTDIHGIQLMEKNAIELSTIRCKFRVLDSFGTEARFNYMNRELLDESYYAISLAKAEELLRNPYGYGDWKLHLKQFMTLFPHSPDNSFLGFVVGNSTRPPVNMTAKEDTCLVYGKMTYMWEGKAGYLTTVGKHCEIHATVAGIRPSAKKTSNATTTVSKFMGVAINYGLLSWEKIQSELEKNKIFIGLGFPFEGPAPLEAIAKGAVFINPKLNPPAGRLHDPIVNRVRFFDGKPTLRELTSQHPYLEQFVGKPHVFTVDIANRTELNETLGEIFQLFREDKIEPYLPYEFTHEGLLDRLNTYIQNQDFCSPLGTNWPPKDAMSVIISSSHESCKQACERKGLLCDNDLFRHANRGSMFAETGVGCRHFTQKRSLLAPFVRNGTCTLQSEKLYYSCVDAADDDEIQRLCPCRDFIKGQVALCSKC